MTYYPIYYVEPLEKNSSAIGLDLGSQPVLLDAMQLALKSGEIIATQPFNLPAPFYQSNENTQLDGINIAAFAPLFKNTNASAGQLDNNPDNGFLLLVIDINDFINSSLLDAKHNLSTKISDITNEGDKRLVYTSSDHMLNGHEGIFSKTIEIYDRKWLVTISKNHTRTVNGNWGAVLILAMGCVISIIAAGYILQLSRRRKYFEELVAKRTQEIQELSSAMENAVEGVSQLDKDGLYTYVNEAYASISGYTPRELIGQPWSATVAYTNFDEMSTCYESMKKDGHVTAVALGVRKDHSYFHKTVTMISRLDNEGQFNGHFCFMSDISTRKYAEEKLIQSNVELGRFAYMASHELLKPLAIISKNVKRLEEKHQKHLDEVAHSYLKSIHESSQQMHTLLDDLLVYGHFDQDSDMFGTTDTQLECKKVIDGISPLIEESNANISFKNLPTINASPNRIHQLFKNLITNAIVYCDPERNPDIHIDCCAQADNWLFSVADNGMGIAKEHLDQIFLVFNRVHGAEKKSGTGIGLAICQKIVASLNGAIWAESNPGKGTTIYFTLPNKPAIAQPSKEENEKNIGTSD